MENAKIKEWYIDMFPPEDELGYEINEGITFKELVW